MEVKAIEGANCKNCLKNQGCDFIAERHAECVSSLYTGCTVQCCDYEKDERDEYDKRQNNYI